MTETTTYQAKKCLKKFNCYASKDENGSRSIRIGKTKVGKTWRSTYEYYLTEEGKIEIESVASKANPSNKIDPVSIPNNFIKPKKSFWQIFCSWFK